MIESWLQWTCDGCGDTDTANISNQTRGDLRKIMKDSGWKRRGKLDYCPICIKNGRMKRKETVWDDTEQAVAKDQNPPRENSVV